MEKQNDFSKGSIPRTITRLAIPMMVAQLINVLYNIVDRIYVGHMPGDGTLALTGLGLAFPIITLITAFTNLCGEGGAPLCSIARGAGEEKKAEKIIGNSFFLLLVFGVLVMAAGFLFKRPILAAFGASADTLPYADAYITIYLFGTLFSMLGLGMNSFISSQGFAKTAMMTTCLGAVINIVLDPVFIYLLHMGVRGAALATVIAQFFSMLWVLRFLTGPKAILKLRLRNIRPDAAICRRICGLGLSNFVMSLTSCAVQVAANKTLSIYGGDIFVGVMTAITSLNEFILKPIQSIGAGSMPVSSYNYGAKKYGRVLESVRFITKACILYSVLLTAAALAFPSFIMRIFSTESEFIAVGIRAMHIYFCLYFMMALQMIAQTTFLSLGMSKYAIFFSIFRKVIIVLPLTILLPLWGLDVWGVFWAEPVSCLFGGLASYLTMRFTVFPRMKTLEREQAELSE